MAVASIKKSKTKAKTRTLAKKKTTKIPARKNKKTAAKTAKKATKKTAKTTSKKVAKKATKKSPAKRAVKKTTAKKAAAPKIISLETTSNVSAPTVTTEAPETARIGTGDTAPDFSLPNQNGETVSLSSLRGKKVVLYFYPKDDTPGCTKEACSFRDHLPRFEGVNAVILGVSFDDANSHQKFITKYGLNFPLLTDADKEVAKAYGVYVQKNMYGNISWGIERSTFVIDTEGKIAQAFRRVQVDGHTEEVIAALNSVQ